jgi:hypothetical protein
MRDVEDEVSGWCRKCAEAGTLERYRDAKDAEVDVLRRRWRRRAKKAFSDAPEALAERQRWHRLKEKTKPRRQPVDDRVNPLQLAFDALQHLSHVQSSVRSNTRALGHLDEVEEALKQLAWAGEDGDGPVEESPASKPRKRRAPRRTFTCQVCGEAFTAIREDAMYCSTGCNQFAYRQRKRGHL